MTTRILKGTLPCPAAELMERLHDERAFPAHAADIVSVEDAGGKDLYRWTLAFRKSTAQWVQRSRRAVDGPAHRIDFEQVEGDFQQFAGAWSCADAPGGCEVSFEVRFRTSVPHLAGAVDSAVGRVLVRSAHRILTAVGGPVRITSGGHHLRDLPEELLARRTPIDAL
ncbi:SRPBCC family protein [Streptomyces sp. NPDC085927]|uniref:SRPBCC family protein n=1 Tax=Streptomyces sp. NPDC085927 TaxID=3365738 RepID=UPI0037CFBA19